MLVFCVKLCQLMVVYMGVVIVRSYIIVDVITAFSDISQSPKLCVKISILRHRHMWVRSFSTRLTSVTFAEDKVLIFLILRKNAKIVQL